MNPLTHYQAKLSRPVNYLNHQPKVISHHFQQPFPAIKHHSVITIINLQLPVITPPKSKQQPLHPHTMTPLILPHILLEPRGCKMCMTDPRRYVDVDADFYNCQFAPNVTDPLRFDDVVVKKEFVDAMLEELTPLKET